ncbi:MAG: MFS transporter [Ignavibacteria bacterium RIFOXYA2_FULL_37_17]|nr:MAG: MFS transporter [Ignavibacteria bacterium RIFOXYA2_FULL_37_17]
MKKNLGTDEKYSSLEKPKLSWQATFAALKHRNYRLWFFGQIISLFGSWMQMTAQGFFIFELTHSPAFLGYVGFANGIPTWLFMVYGGVMADRFSRRNIMMVTQTVMMLLAFILAALTFTNIVEPWHILLLTFGLGIANAFDAPARQAFVNELVPREDLLNAIALNSMMFHSAAAIGPAVAGIIYAVFGPAWCFTINGITFLAVIYNLYIMKFQPAPKRIVNKSAFKELLDGLQYLKTQKMILLIMLVVSFSTFFGLSLATLFPAWAVNILHGDAATNGFLQTARGIGAVICSLLIASLSRYIVRGKILTTGLISLPILMILFSLNSSFIISSLILIGVGAAIIAINNLSNGLTQTLVSEEFRGRVMGVYSFSFFGFMPLGALWIGMLAEHFSSPIAILINSVILFIFVGVVWFYTPKLRKII